METKLKNKEMIDELKRVFPSDILTREEHEKNLNELFYLLHLYLNSNKVVQKKVQEIIDIWKARTED